MGSFGGSVATPHLDRLAGESERWTTATRRRPGPNRRTRRLLTGYHPETHRAILLDQGMDAAVPTLAERFRAAGFLTSALVFDCTWLSPRWGFGKGFDTYRVTQWRAGPQARAAADWVLDHRDRDFLLLPPHLRTPHGFCHPALRGARAEPPDDCAEFGVEGFGCRGGFCGRISWSPCPEERFLERPKDKVILREHLRSGRQLPRRVPR